MSELIEVTGMVLSAVPVLENDKRITLLTAERGKLTVFCRGAKKPTSRLMAATNPLCMGRFSLFPGKSAYNLGEAHISNYFDELRSDFEGALYGMYFADVAGYYSVEGGDETNVLNLLYVSLRALLKPEIDRRLVQCLYEMKMLVIQGEFPGITTQRELSPTCVHVINYCVETGLERLFSFTVTEEVLQELEQECMYYRRDHIGHHFKSLDILRDALDK